MKKQKYTKLVVFGRLFKKITMKQLLWKIVLPITIITFSIFTKWWYVLPVDGPDTVMSGFPLIWLSDGWHTSLSLQIFVTELIVNLLVYFLFWSVLIFSINRHIIVIKIPKMVTILLLTVTGLIVIGAIWIGTMPEHIYKTKRDFDIEVLTTGYKFMWQPQSRPNYEDYKSIKNREK